MNEYERQALNHAHAFAPEVQTLLELSNEQLTELQSAFEKVLNDQARFSELASLPNRGDWGDVISIAAILINLFMWLEQIRLGQVLKGASGEEVVSGVITRVLDDDALPVSVKERLVSQAINHLSAKAG